LLETTLDPQHNTCSPDRSIKCSGTSRAPRSKANPYRAGHLTPLGNRISALFAQPALCSHTRRCAGVVWEGRCHSVTLCRLLPYPLHVAPLERGRRHPRKGYDHLLHTHLGQHRDIRPVERVPSITSDPMRPFLPLYRHPGHYRVIPYTVGTQVDRTSPLPSLCSLRSPVSQTLESVYRHQSSKSSSATTLEAAPGRAQDPPQRLPGTRFSRTVVNPTTLRAMSSHNT
jgi:hypothetical protein